MKNILLLIAFASFFNITINAQSNNCNLGNAGAQISVGNSCNYSVWDIPDNGNYWTSFTGCGANGTNDVWAWFVAASTSTTIRYRPYHAFNPVIHVFTGSCSAGMTAIACSNSTGYNQVETLTLTTVVGQTYMVRIEPQDVAAGNGARWGDLCVFNTVPVIAPNATCAQPNPICSGTPINFTANSGGTPASTTNPLNNYYCLYTSPNPSWYYLQIANPGQLIVDITAGSDVDFAIWGPFTNLANAQANCNSYGVPVDCSYSFSAIEQVNVPATLTGQVYVLLVTNYANTVQNINVSNAGGSATTNCSIVPLPVGFSFWDVSVVNDDVLVTWETESEHNNSHFLVQRSADGMIWETIGIVEGNGTTSQSHAYSYRDSDPELGLNYYRLNQVDKDGKSELTTTLVANTLSKKSLSVYPNPAHGLFTIQINPKDVSEIYMSDVIGKIHHPEITDGGESLIVNTDGMSNGIYTITAIVNGEKIVQRIIIQ